MQRPNLSVVNGTLPGPTLRFTEGDHIFINVVNNAQHNVTIHWYCVKTRIIANVGMVCPNGVHPSQMEHQNLNIPLSLGILLYMSFCYKVTLFYHSHIGMKPFHRLLISGMQASSCFGVIVVEPADGIYPFTFDDERIVAVSDFWHASNDQIESGLLAPQVFRCKRY